MFAVRARKGRKSSLEPAHEGRGPLVVENVRVLKPIQKRLAVHDSSAAVVPKVWQQEAGGRGVGGGA